MKPHSSFHQRRTKSGWFRFITHCIDIRRQLWVTLVLIVLHRLLLSIPLPGFPTQLTPDQSVDNPIYTIVEFAEMLSAGGLLKASILGLGLLPFKLSGQLLDALVENIPALKNRLLDNPYEARKNLKKWKTYLALPFGLLEGMIFLNLSITDCSNVSLFTVGMQFEPLQRVMIVLVLTTGSFIAYWISELISKYGIKEMGARILVLGGILSRIPSGLTSLYIKPGAANNIMIYILELIVSIILVIYFQSARHNVKVMFPGRRVGNRISESVKSHLPLKLWNNGADGFIGSQLLVALTTFYAPLAVCSDRPLVRKIASGVISIFSKKGPYFGPVTFFNILLFACLYSNLRFEQMDYGTNLKREGAHIPGVERDSQTNTYLQRLNKRLSFVGGVIFGLLAILPWISNLIAGTDISLLNGEKILIAVTSIIDIFEILQVEMLLHGYGNTFLV